MTQIYLISPPRIDDIDAFINQLDEVIAAGVISVFQLRLKGIENREIVLMGKKIVPKLQEAGIAVIINDNPRIAKDLHADGVHLGQEDGDIVEARKLLGKDAIIGVTCHNSKHLGMEAAENGADYVAFGAFYPTQTKEVVHHAEIEILEWWQDIMEIPCVAIGGINIDNALPIINAGADFIAVSSGVWNYEGGIKAALKKFQNLIENKN
ncbi:MAG: thiamine phosphate synthase [Caulobacterales bacterium]|nr:thiamine phosphate synthase [Caulobacterales bacterium]MCA0371681.1 thiamine phosphate synthase [Pseudomonadota bacterium]